MSRARRGAAEPTGRSAFASRVRAELRAAVELLEPEHGLEELRDRITTRGGATTMGVSRTPPPHNCPALRCPAMVPDRLLMCAPHWHMVPGPVQRAVWDAYENHGRGSAQLRAAHRAAIDHVNHQLEEE